MRITERFNDVRSKNVPAGAVRILILLILITTNIGTTYAIGTRPWYASGFEKLGFFVFDPPMAMKDFLVIGLGGASKTRASAKGNIVLLNFWATWCPPCKEEMPSIESLYVKMKGKKFEIMAINLGDSVADVKAFIKEHGYTFPAYLDPQDKLSSGYAGQGIPTTYILDKQGRFIAGVVGGVDYSKPEIVNLLSALAEQ